MTQDCFLVGPILFSLSPKFSVSTHNINQRFLIIKWPYSLKGSVVDPQLSPFPPCSLVCWCSLSTRLLLEFPVDEMFDCELPRRLVLKDRRSWWAAVVYSGLVVVRGLVDSPSRSQ
jgi:hypothetical protein